MKLTDLIKSLTDVVAEVGDVDVYITTANETQLYDTVLIHYIEENKYLKEPILRLEGTTDEEAYEELGEEEEDEQDFLDRGYP